MALQEISDVLGNKLKTVQEWIKVLKQLFGYEKGQALRRISTPTEFNEEIALGKYGPDTNIMISFLDLVENRLNKTVPDQRVYKIDSNGDYERDNDGKKILKKMVPYTDNSISKFAHGIAVGSGSQGATRMKLSAQLLGQMQPENSGVDNEYPAPEHEDASED